MQANDKQVAGNHYASKFQHWDFVLYITLPYLPSQVTRYIARWKKKNGMEDLEKAHHYMCKFIEEEHRRHEGALVLMRNFIKENNLGEHETIVFNMLVNYHLGDGDRLIMARDAIEELMNILKGAPLAPKEEPTFMCDGDEWWR